MLLAPAIGLFGDRVVAGQQQPSIEHACDQSGTAILPYSYIGSLRKTSLEQTTA